jgi:biopolymer transport protein ExbB/TolQ
MNEQNNQNADIRPLLYLIMAAVIAYAVIYIVLLAGVILTVGLTAGAGYLGYKAAMDTQLWEDRRIGKDRKLEAARKAELAYFESQGKEWMTQVVNNHYDDQERELYQNNGDHVETISKNIRKVKELFK